jgi:hypothetical protein
MINIQQMRRINGSMDRLAVGEGFYPSRLFQLLTELR